MRTHQRNHNHKKQIEAMSTVSTEGTVIYRFHRIRDSEKIKNRNAIESFLLSTHFLCMHTTYSPHNKFLISLLSHCFLWGYRLLVKQLFVAPFFSLMATDYTDITTVQELSLYCRWIEDIAPVEHFMEYYFPPA